VNNGHIEILRFLAEDEPDTKNEEEFKENPQARLSEPEGNPYHNENHEREESD
jgi:hypothetical protein